MAGAPVKFRCYKCNQLLGVSRSRIGAEVSCPKCATALVVPDPDEAASAAAPDATSESQPSSGLEGTAETTPAFLSALAAGLPIELADIRPEDIRAERGSDWSPPLVSTAPQPPVAEPYPLDVPMAPAAERVRSTPYGFAPASAPMAVPVPPPIAAPAPAPPPVDPLVSAIRLEPPALTTDRTVVRSRDLVMPRSVVAFWSLFVLLAQALAFLAGLLAGHFLWRVH
jgi:hypothetical protein